MLLSILHYPDERLRIVAKPVHDFDHRLQILINDMLETMYQANGIGLAATQVGINLRVIVMDLSENRNEPITFINPSLSEISKETNAYEEGCLSVPNINEVVIRPKTVIINAKDIYGRDFTLPADGLLATCIQHEIDHLDGKVFIDRISKLKKSRIDDKIKKSKKNK